MINLKDRNLNGFFGSNLYLILSILIGIPIYIVIDSYLQPMNIHEDEAVSFAAAVSFIFGVFAGRYISQHWSSRLKSIPVPQVLGLAFIIVISIAWPFFSWVGNNLLLFWISLGSVSIATGVLIKMIHAVTQNQLKEAETVATHSKSELHLLQSQLSPHFLFNTLNNMYGLSITDHQKIPELLLKLSDLLRYSVYDATEIYVPLKDEMTYINNYIEFEKIRIGDRLVLTTDLEDIKDKTIQIAPMLLIVFIENAFKHSKNTSEEHIFIDISLKTWGNSILFSIKNSYEKQEPENNMLHRHSGFGHANVNKRLQLLYPNAYELEIQSDAAYYQVNLQLKTK